MELELGRGPEAKVVTHTIYIVCNVVRSLSRSVSVVSETRRGLDGRNLKGAFSAMANTVDETSSLTPTPTPTPTAVQARVGLIR